MPGRDVHNGATVIHFAVVHAHMGAFAFDFLWT